MSEFRKTIHSEADTTSGTRRGRGAPAGNRNAWKTGRYSREVLDKLKVVIDFKRKVNGILADVDEEVEQSRAAARRRRKLGPRKRVLKK